MELTAASDRILDREELSHLDPNVLADLLRGRVVGAFSMDAGVRNDLYRSVRIRGPIGFPGCPTCAPKVLLDGVELSPDAISSVDASRLERVRVIRGPQAGILYGANAASGVILLTSMKGPAREGTSITAIGKALVVSSPYRTDPRMGQKLAGSVGGRTESGISYDVGVTWRSLPSHVPEYEAEGRTATFGFSGPVGRLTLSGSARYAERDFSRPGWAVAYYHLYSDGLLPAWGDHIDDNDFGDFRHFTFGLNLDFQHTDNWRTRLTVGRDQFDNDLRSIPDFESGDSMVTLETSRYEIPSTRLISSAFFGMPFGGIEVQAGADRSSKRRQKYESYHEETGQARITNWRGQILDEVATTGGLFANLRLQLDRDLTVSVGNRADQHSLFGEQFGSWTWSPRVALEATTEVAGGWRLSPGLSWGVGFSAPNLEMRTGINNVAANPDLGPQRTSGWEAGLGLRDASGRFNASTTLFRQVTTDGIGRIESYPGEDTLRFINFFGTIQNTGVEAQLSWVSPSTTLRANGYLAENLVRNPRDVTEEHVEEDVAPEAGAWIEADQSVYDSGPLRLRLGARGRYIGKRWAYDPRGYFEAIADGYEIASDHRWFDPILRADLFASVSYRSWAEARLEVENVTDNLANEIPEIVLPGREVSLSLRVRL